MRSSKKHNFYMQMQLKIGLSFLISLHLQVLLRVNPYVVHHHTFRKNPLC